MIQKGIATFTLDYGKCPKWLFDRMVLLSKRMIYLRNMFAQTELNVARYYYERRMYVAAVERGNYLIKTYPQASSVQAALTLVYSANKALGLDKAADEVSRVYQASYHSQPELLA